MITSYSYQTRPERRLLWRTSDSDVRLMILNHDTVHPRLPLACCRLKATPEYRQWAARRRRERVRKALTSASTLRAVTMLVLAGAAFWAGQIAPPGTIPELLQPSTAPAEPQIPASQPSSELLLQLETERNLAQSYGSRVEKLSARMASLQSEHHTELQHRLGRHQEELLRREKQLRDLEAKAASDSKAERARLEQAEKASAKALAEAQAQQAQMRGQLERLQSKLARAQEVTVPPVRLCSISSCFVGRRICMILYTRASDMWMMSSPQDRRSGELSCPGPEDIKTIPGATSV